MIINNIHVPLFLEDQKHLSKYYPHYASRSGPKMHS